MAAERRAWSERAPEAGTELDFEHARFKNQERRLSITTPMREHQEILGQPIGGEIEAWLGP